jgi:hypothetical protein
MEQRDEKAPKLRPAFLPKAVANIQDLDIPQTLIEDLMIRRLSMDGSGSIICMSNSLKLPVPVVQQLFERLRQQHIFEVTGMEGYNYSFTLSGRGRDYATKRISICQYAGPAPVSLRDYQSAVRKQASKVRLNRTDLEQCFSDLVLTSGFLDQLGPALVSQNSLFLYGPTGNGKTSVVRRLSRIYKDPIVIPYAVEFQGQIIVLFDPAVHQAVGGTEGIFPDPRWVCCNRPCVLVGGELEPSMLELKLDDSSGIYAAPIQMKANNGMLVIDDFGRQILSPQYLLNRWIVPMDRKIDYLTLRYGVKFEIPFEITVVFSTNLDPTELADEAFLRRIQNKIYMEPVQAEVFDDIFRRLLADRNLTIDDATVPLLRDICLRLGSGDLRACYPVDILNILDSISIYEEHPITITNASLERAISNYFAATMSV